MTSTYSDRSSRPGRHRGAFDAVGLLLVVMVLTGCEVLTYGFGAQSYPGESWSSTPLPPDQGLAEAAPGLCGAVFGLDPGSGLRIAVQAQHSTHRAAFILISDEGMVDCILSRPPGGEPTTGGGGGFGSTDTGGPTAADELSLGGESAGPPASRAYGRVGSDITSVRVMTSNSGPVEASIGDGWFLAMWPGVGQVASVEGRDEAGNVVTIVPGFANEPYP